MKIKVDTTLRELSIDSIDCIYDSGRKVRTTAGVVGDFIIDIEGNQVTPDQFTLTEYKMSGDTTQKELKRTATISPSPRLLLPKKRLPGRLKPWPWRRRRIP